MLGGVCILIVFLGWWILGFFGFMGLLVVWLLLWWRCLGCVWLSLLLGVIRLIVDLLFFLILMVVGFWMRLCVGLWLMCMWLMLCLLR